jgi:hypothetical protein
MIYPELPWQDISTLTPELGGDPVFVWNGERMLFANWRYGWSFDDVNTDDPCWCDDGMVLLPRPTHFLPLSPPRTQK